MDLTRVKQIVDDLDVEIEAKRADLPSLVTETSTRTVALMLQRERPMAAQAAVDRPVRHESPYMPGRAAKPILGALERAGDRV